MPVETKHQGALLLRRHLLYLKSPLYPLLSITTGTPHQFFPATLLHYHILSEAQLDELAHYYHQRTPTIHSLYYPAPLLGNWKDCTIEQKRRRFGRFVGLQGCDSPGVRDEASIQQRWIEQWVAERIHAGMAAERKKDDLLKKGL